MSDGRPGTAGADGARGAEGAAGMRGEPGVAGPMGAPGLDAHEFEPRVALDTSRPHLLWWEKVGLVVVSLLLLGGGVTLKQNADLAQAQRDGVDRNNQGRAVLCRLSIVVGIDIEKGGPCTDPAVLKYYDPVKVKADLEAQRAKGNAAIDQIAENKDLVCRLLTLQGVTDTRCESP